MRVLLFVSLTKGHAYSHKLGNCQHSCGEEKKDTHKPVLLICACPLFVMLIYACPFVFLLFTPLSLPLSLSPAFQHTQHSWLCRLLSVGICVCVCVRRSFLCRFFFSLSRSTGVQVPANSLRMMRSDLRHFVFPAHARSVFERIRWESLIENALRL